MVDDIMVLYKRKYGFWWGLYESPEGYTLEIERDSKKVLHILFTKVTVMDASRQELLFFNQEEKSAQVFGKQLPGDLYQMIKNLDCCEAG